MEGERGVWAAMCVQDGMTVRLIAHDDAVGCYLYFTQRPPDKPGRPMWQVWLSNERICSTLSMQEAYRRYNHYAPSPLTTYETEVSL